MTSNGSLVAASAPDELMATSPGDELIQRLDDPEVAASLSLILDHADLVATLLTGLDGLVRRGDVISDSLASAIGEVRDVASAYTAANNGQKLLPDVDMASLRATVTDLSTAFLEAAPAFSMLLRSPLTDPQTAHLIAEVGDALLEGKAAAEADPRGPKGVFALMKVAKDPDVSRGLGFMIHVARAFGRRLAQDPPRTSERGPRHSA